jgi:hypothetical protein
MSSDVAFKCNETFSVISIALDPTKMYPPAREIIIDDDDITAVTSNVSEGSTTSLESARTEASQMHRCMHRNTQDSIFSSIAPHKLPKWGYSAMRIASNEAIAALGANQIFVMDGIPIHYRRRTMCPLNVALADGRRVMLAHMCDIIIPGLPTTLVGHIVPELSIASLFGIRVLTAAGRTVKFDNDKCIVKYNGNIILTGTKDPTTDLWTLPIVGSASTTSQMDTRDEQNAFTNLLNQFLEKTDAAQSATGQKVKTKRPPPPPK